MVDKQKILQSLYENVSSPHSFSGIQNLLKSARKENPSISRQDVVDFLQKIDAYILHKITRKKFLRRKILSPKPGIIASCDLADMSTLSKYNNGIKYILVFIDVFSRFAQAVGIKRKDGPSVCSALKSILESGYFDKLNRLNSDEGKEFYNKHVNQLLDSKGIVLYSVSSREIKASIAERVIRTIKGKLYRYMSHCNTRHYIDILDEVIDSYNHSSHSGLGNQQTPFHVHHITDPLKIEEQFYRMYKYPKHVAQSNSRVLTVGQHVRIADEKRNATFRRGYTIQNTIEIFRIRKIDQTQIPTIYFLEDLQGENIKGIFYRDELVPTNLPEIFHIDVIKSKSVAGRKKYFVRWRGYPDSFNSWIDEDQIQPL